MKLTIPAADLKKLLKRLNTVKAEHTTLDTIEGSVSASDNELTMVVRSAALKAQEGAQLTLVGKTFSSLVNGLAGEVVLSFDGGPLKIQSGKGKFELPVTVTPLLKTPSSEGKPFVQFPKKDFLKLLEFAASAADEKQRFEFSGSVQVKSIKSAESIKSTTRAAGTNHHRLAVADAEFSESVDILVPVRAVHAINDLDGDVVMVSKNDSVLFFESETSTIVARKLASNFPQYEQMIKFEPALKIQADAAVVGEVLERIAPLISDDEHNRIELTFRGETLQISTGRIGTGGTASDEVGVEPIVPDPLFEEISEFRTAANYRYISDFFKMVSGKITISAKDQRSPLLLESGKLQLFVAPLAV